MMRMLLMLMAILSFAVMTNPANAETKLTHAQVDAVCGGSKPNSSGHSGCVKECGNNVCLYDCKGKGKNEDCRGYVALTTTGGSNQDQPEAYLPPTPGVVLVMDFVSFGSLQSACTKVRGGIFTKTGDNYACANPACDKSGGTCMVICVNHACHALMPSKPDASLSLLAILQGGDKVSHQYGLPEPKTQGTGGTTPVEKPAAPTGPIIG